MSIRKRTWTTPRGEPKTAWLVDYRDGAGARRSKQFARKKDADAWQTRTGWEVSQGTHTADSQSVTVALAGQLWLDRAKRDGLEPTTVAAYSQHVRLHINPHIGAKKLSQLRKPVVEEFRDTLLDTRSRPMAIRVLRSLSMIVSEAERRGLVAQNVCRGVRVKRSDRAKPRVAIPPKADIRAFLDAAKRHPNPMSWPFACAAVFAGPRASELRGLSWQSVDLRAASVTVEQRADNRNVIGPPKSEAGLRTIPMAPLLVAALRSWKLQCPPSELDLVFPSDAGTPIFYLSLVERIVEPVLISAGLTRPKMRGGKPILNDEGQPVLEGKYSLHEFRHAAASLWIEQLVDPKRIQTWMGHHSIQYTFDTYGHLFQQLEGDSAAMARAEASLFAIADATQAQHAN